MLFDLLNRDRTDLLGDQPGEPFVDAHTKSAYAFAAESERRCQNEVGAVRFEQIC